LIPGDGGGARPSSGVKVGSRHPDYAAHGAVIVRVTKVS
jgi:hypothetical protein